MGTRAASVAADLEGADAPRSGTFRLEKPEFEVLRQLIYDETGISLAPTKRVLLESRLSKRLRALALDSFAEYCAYLATDLATELVPLINCVTTNKTDFFREPHHFAFLRDHVLPAAEARAARTGRRRLRIWSAGCSTGEEPYSLALTLREWLDSHHGWDVRVLASDIDTNVLEAAASGCYHSDRVVDVPIEWRRKWFKPVAGRPEWLQIDRSIQELITFRRINFVDEPWPIQTTFDAIFCRNVIIYFNRDTQTRLLGRFASILEPDGHLVIGHSESLAWLSDTFTSVRGQPTVYALVSSRQTGAAKAASAKPAPAIARKAPAAPKRRPARQLGIGEAYVSGDGEEVRAILGSSMAVAIFDAEARVGGICRLLGSSVESALDGLRRRLVESGAVRDRLRAKVFGAAVLSDAPDPPTAGDSISAVKAWLTREQIAIAVERTGGESPMELVFFTDTGRALLREVPVESCREWLAQESAA